jgi:hypothetical protein
MRTETFTVYEPHTGYEFAVTASYERQAYDPAVGMRGEYVVLVDDAQDDAGRTVKPSFWMEAAFAQELYDRDERRSRP